MAHSFSLFTLSDLIWTKHLPFNKSYFIRDGSRAVATSKMERFVIIVNGFQPLTIITKRSILDVAAALDPPLLHRFTLKVFSFFLSAN